MKKQTQPIIEPPPSPELDLIKEKPVFDLAIEKPMFLAEDLDIKEAVKFRSDEARKLNERIDALYKLMHDKGLEAGLPKVLLNDISRLTGMLNRLSNVLDDEKFQEREKEKDTEISKKFNRGDVYLAFHDKEMQLQEYKQSLLKIKTIIWSIVNDLAALQSRLIGKDIYQLER